MIRNTAIFGAALMAAALICPHAAQAYTFTPTDIEWQTWAGYCKAKYAWTNVGKRSKFANKVTTADRAELKVWEDHAVRGVHHYCAGTIWLQRARSEENARQRKYMLNQATDETLFAFERSIQTGLYFPYLAMQMASILYEQGDSIGAIRLLQSQTSKSPKNALLYSATAIMQRKVGQLADAKLTLLNGHDILDGKSAENSYNLALICMELGELDDAERYARLAYELGYPLPGLRKKLNKIGRLL